MRGAVAREQAFLNAEIRTMDPRNPVATALLVRDGRVAAIGSDAAILRRIASSSGPRRDVKGITLVPGLVDSHTHLVHQGLLKARVDLSSTRSLAEALAAVKRRVRSMRPGALLIAERWDESRWTERRFPHREDLDALSRTVPIVLRRVDGHVAVGNTEACRLIAAKLPGVEPETGRLVEEASLNLNQAFPTPPAEADDALRAAQEQALALGITTVHDFVVPGYVGAYQRLREAGRLKLRAHVSLYIESLDALEAAGIRTGWGDDRLRLSGVKLFADGSLGGHTAALHAPYKDTPDSTGRLNFEPRQLNGLIERADRAGLRVSAHAIGDRAIDEVASALRGRSRRLRHRIEHYELHTDASEEILSHERVVASMQPNFVGAWNRRGGLYEQRIGTRARRANEFRRLQKAQIAVAFGSDCMPLDPWFGLESCTRAPHAFQRLPFEEALRCYTAAGADALGETDVGRLRVGSHADFVLVRLDPRRPSAAEVRATFAGGVEAYRRRL